jgi:flagellar biosynthesis GTPase FlhF
MTKAQARAQCRQQMKIIAARAKEKKLTFAKKLSEDVARQKERAREACKRLISGASKPAPMRRKASKKKASKKKASKKKASKKKASKKKASKKKASKKKARRAAPRASYADQLARIKKAMRSPAARKFGPNKVFIASVWEQLRTDRLFRAGGRRGFDELLLRAHQDGDLRMARADLVSAMNRKDVDDSEIAHLNATFHFLDLDSVSARRSGNPIADLVRYAYAELKSESGLRNVSVHDLRKRSGVTRAQLHAFLNAERKARRANATIGEPTAVNRAQLADALVIDGSPHMFVELHR